MTTAAIQRSTVTLHPDRSRVLLRPFLATTDRRAVNLTGQIMALPESEVHALWEQVRAEFGERHVKIEEFLRRRCERLPVSRPVSEERAWLLGAYFSNEYSLEAAALFNPSMVPHPELSDLPAGSLRFVLSLRATGEGHISSITFRTGIVDATGTLTINPPARYCLEPDQIPNPTYEKGLFGRKLDELGLADAFSRQALHGLGEKFTLGELRASLRTKERLSAARKIMMVAQSNYEVQFPPDSRLSERVLFPTTPSQRKGIEDARFVWFRHADGTRTYYATYTAYDGKMVLPQFIETPDFRHFKFVTLNGPAVQNKGLALFPRLINGRYVMLGRQDAENIYLMDSDNLHFWNSAQLLVKPKFPWEWVQLGNCGSPIETEAGWLVLSHGVGAMRKYCIGAFLLDRDDPRQVIGRLREPLIKPDANEREGYVPNVVYSCGSLLHGPHLIIPYAMADSATTFAAISVEDVLARME
jgi:predicted GH43/DUF377 family glycosyl hydrolase